MERQPDYTRILKEFAFEEPDRLPTMELLIDLPIQTAILGRPIKTIQDEVDFYVAAGYDYVYQKAQYEFPGIPPVLAFGTKVRIDAQEDGTDVHFDPETSGRPLADEPGFDRYPWPDPDTVDVASVQRTAQALPEGMGIVAGVGGIFARSWILMGFDNLCMKLFDDQAFVKRVIDRIGSIQVGVAKRLVKLERVFALWYSDDVAYAEAPMIEPGLIRRFLFPHMEEMCAAAHEAGMPFIYHGCGNVGPFIDDLVAMGVDALHPIEPKALDIYALKPKLYGKMALIGNIDVGEVLTLGSKELIEEDVKRHIRDLAPGGGYVLSSSNSITHYIPVENYRHLLDCVHRYGGYPVR
jgi:uroporphyrinogen decarboxylase